MTIRAAQNETSAPDVSVDAPLLERARKGDADAWARLCDLHRKRVWAVAASVTKSGADADDLAQDALIRAWKSLPGFRGDAPFEAWLCRIALHAAQDWARSAWRRRVLSWGAVMREDGREEAAPDNSPHEEATRRETQRRVREAVARLGAKERTPIWLMYFEGFSLADVARLEDVPESTIRSRVKTGLKRLHRPLQDLADVEDAAPANGTALPVASASPETAVKSSQTPWKGCAT